jgi:DNA-binding CsgD family transcriptional regulator
MDNALEILNAPFARASAAAPTEMNPLRTREVKAFSGALEKIHSETDLAQFPTRVFGVFEELIPGIVLTLDEFNVKTGDTRNSISRPPNDLAAWRQQLTTLIPTEHPVFPVAQAAALKGRTLPALRISDFLTLRQLRRTNLYHDIFAPIGVRHQIVLSLRVRGHVAGLTISRWEDFTEAELALAQLLSPHLALAHMHAQSLTALKKLELPSALTDDPDPIERLTPREREILHWVTQGKRDSEIAIIVGASPRTVQKHVQRILSKLGVETRTAAALETLRRSASHP